MNLTEDEKELMRLVDMLKSAPAELGASASPDAHLRIGTRILELFRRAIDTAAIRGLRSRRFIDNAADALAEEAQKLQDKHIFDRRSPIGDALYEYKKQREEDEISRKRHD